MSQENGFRIRGIFYPDAPSRRLADAALIEQVTGLTQQQYIERAKAQYEEAMAALRRFKEAKEAGDLPEDAEMEVPAFDDLISLGAIAIAVSRFHPSWSRTRVHEFVKGLEDKDIDFVFSATDEDDKDAEEGDDGPPAPQETDSNPGSTSPPPLRSVSEPGSNGSETQQTSGQTPSPMSPVAP